MKKMFVIFLAFLFASQVKSQVRKDTVQLDSTEIENIKKMPIDTIYDKMPTKPVLPEEQKKNSIITPTHLNRKGKYTG